MANLSNVDAEKISSTASKLMDIEAQILDLVGKIADDMVSLDKGWNSDVKNQFMNIWVKDSDAMIEMVDQYEELDNLLEETAKAFESNEEEMLAEVGKLK